MKSIKSIKSISSVLFVQEALRRGIIVKHINHYKKSEAFLELNYKKHKEFIIGQRISLTSFEAYWALENKDITRYFLKKNCINISLGKVFEKSDYIKVFSYCDKIGFPIVVKPTIGAHGNQVFIGIKNKKDLEEAVKKILKENSCVLVEKMFFGKEYRIVATRNKFLAATYREPANIVGDGVHSIRELIKIKNSDSRRGDSCLDIFVKIKIDNIVKSKLIDAKMKFEDILPEGKKLYLKDTSNISTGGDSIDVTEKIHSDFKKIAVEIIRAFPGLSYGGIDLMSNQDISKKPTKKSYIVLEVNSSPGISLQHYPFKGKSRNVAKEIIDILFPETKNKVKK